MLNISFYMKPNSLFIIFLLACTMLLSGCLVTAEYYRKADYDIELINKIAVLPFENLTLNRYSGEKMKEKVIIELLRSGYDVVEEGEVTSLLMDLKIRDASVMTLDDIRSFGEELGVEAVVKGSVSYMGVVKGVSVDYPEVALNLRMIEVENGDTVWSASNNAGGPSFWTRHFGTEGKTIDEIARKVVKEALDTLK